MSGRPCHDEGVIGVAAHDGIDGCDAAADGMQDCFPGAVADRRIGIEIDNAFLGNDAFDRCGISRRMHAQDRFEFGLWRRFAFEIAKCIGCEGLVDGAKARLGFRMARAGVVAEAGGMVEEQSCHRGPMQSE